MRFFVNGEYYGPFVLTERFDERYFAAHWGYDDILLSQEEMNKLWDWVLATRPLTMANVSQHVNIDNLTRWFLAVAFCATRDAYQGPGQFLDQTKTDGRLVLGELGHGSELSRLEPRQLSVPARAGRRAAPRPQSAPSRGR